MPIDQYKIEIVSAFDKYAKKLNSSKTKNYLKFEPFDMGYPHVEIQESGELHYVVTERGAELERRKTTSVEELMYWMFDPVISEIAFRFAAQNKGENADSRRVAFPKMLNLFEALNPNWRKRKEIYLEQTLINNPYLD